MQIIILDDKNNEHLKLWKDFLDREKHLIVHTPSYKKFIDNTFKCKTYYVAAIEEKTVGKENLEEIRTLLPVFHIKHFLLGKKLISSGFLEYGSFAGNSKYVADIINFLYKEFSHKAEYLEIRHGLEGYDKELSGLLTKTSEYKRALLHLADIDKVWKNIQEGKRKAIKKAERDGIKVRELGKHDIDEIYRLYLKNMKYFGSPAFSKKFFTSFFDNIAANNMGKCFGAFFNIKEKGGKQIKEKLVSVLLGFAYEDSIHITISVSDERYLNLRPNDALHWAFIKYACEHGFKLFDFGRVREDSGQFEYKKKWGTKIVDLPHYYLLWRSNKLPKVDPNNPKYRIAVYLWKRMPIFVSRYLGPWLREGLGI